jgi:hypothetical protein
MDASDSPAQSTRIFAASNLLEDWDGESHIASHRDHFDGTMRIQLFGDLIDEAFNLPLHQLVKLPLGYRVRFQLTEQP